MHGDFQVKATEEPQRCEMHMERPFREENMKDSREDAAEQQMRGTLYFMNFKWKKEISTHTY